MVGIVVHGNQQYGASMVWSAIIGAASSLIGGALNRSAANDANERAAEQAEVNRQEQERFAKLGLTWRAEDAMNAYKKTGIHPLAMLGVQGSTYSPVSAAFTPASMGDSVARAGQDIGNAIHRGADRALRERALRLQEVQLNNAAERGSLENELLRMNIASQRMRLAQMNAPAAPSAAPTMVDTTRLHQGITDNMDIAREPGSSTGIGYLKMPDGSLMPVKSEAAGQRLEDDALGNLKHFIMREFGPSFWEKDPGRPARPGYRWTVNFAGNWIEVPVRTAPFIQDKYRERWFRKVR